MKIQKKIISVVLAAFTICVPLTFLPVKADAARMVTVGGLKYVNGDTNLLVYSHGTGAGSYAELASARIVGGTDAEWGLVVIGFQGGGFSWSLGYNQPVDTITPEGNVQLWWDPDRDQFFTDANRKYELKENKEELRFLAQRAAENSNWTGAGSKVAGEIEKLRIAPKKELKKTHYWQKIYNFGKTELTLQITRIGDQMQKFIIIENNKAVYRFDAPSMEQASQGTLAALELNGKMFYAYSFYDTGKRVGGAILVGKSPKDEEGYRIYADSNDYYNPGGTTAVAAFDVIARNGRAVNGLRFYGAGYGETTYELSYDAVNDKIEYKE